MPPFTLSRAVAATILPPIPKAQAWIQTYDNSAGPLLNLSQGVPGDPPCQEVLQGLAVASADPASAGYGAIAGEPQLRKMMADEMEDIYKWGSKDGVSAENIFITGGANAAYSECK
jgi:aspartate/methionine/tyrosine aminotransferase